MTRDESLEALAPRRQSVGYLITFAAAMVGIVCLAVAVQGTRRVLQGSDGLGAFNQAGVPALIFALALNFYARLTFTSKLSRTAQSTIRTSVRLVFGLLMVAAVAGSWFVFATGAATADLIGILVVGDLMQLGTLLWLWRYSGE